MNKIVFCKSHKVATLFHLEVKSPFVLSATCGNKRDNICEWKVRKRRRCSDFMSRYVNKISLVKGEFGL